MRLLTPVQIEEVLEIVDRYTLTFVAKHVGKDILTKQDKETLESYGIDLSKIKLNESNVVQAFKYGMLSEAMGHAASQKYTYNQFKESLKSGTFIPLNNQEKAMVQSIQYSTYADINRMGGNIKSDIRQGFVEVDKKGQARAGKIVRDATKEAIEKRKGVNEIVSIIGKKTEAWDKNLARIANYQLHEAFNQGRVSNMKRTKADPKIYFDVFPGACSTCVKAYLTAGFGSEPKVFSLSKIQANGSNIGKKQKEWLPTLGPVHPNCRCTVNEVREGYEWDPSTRTFSKPKKDFERKVERKSKVKVTINDKTTVI